ncbi:MAG: hypothetical protein ACOX4L_07030 [Bacillota bacterium]|jgi:hypothetical protein
MNKKLSRISLPAFIVIIILMLVILFYIGFKRSGHKKPVYGAETGALFSWDKGVISDSGIENILRVQKELPLNRLFQKVPQDWWTGREKTEIRELVKKLGSKGIQVYALTGTPEWAQEEGLESILERIERVADYNKKTVSQERIFGIVIDVEPYQNQKWEAESKEVMAQYTSNMKAAYNYAQKKDLWVVLCIPYWFDNEHVGELEELAANACDELAIMNYYRGNEAENIETELLLAKKYGIGITIIFEFLPPGKHGLTDRNTYYNLGTTAALSVWQDLYSLGEYKKMSCGYHELETLSKLLK